MRLIQPYGKVTSQKDFSLQISTHNETSHMVSAAFPVCCDNHCLSQPPSCVQLVAPESFFCRQCWPKVGSATQKDKSWVLMLERRLSSLTTGQFPPWPIGFRLQGLLPPGGRSVALNPIDVYRLALAALVQRLQFGWSSPARDCEYHLSRRPIVMHLRKHDNSLANMHVMFGICSGTMDMAMRGFPATAYQLRLSGELIASIYVIGMQSSEIRSNKSTTELVGGNGFDISSVAAASGEIFDRDDPAVAIKFRQTGRRISSNDFFYVLMRAAIIVAYDGSSRPFDQLHATNDRGDVALNIRALYSDGEHPARKIGNSLLLILQAAQAGRSLVELEFTVMIGHPSNRKAAAQGFFMRLSQDRASSQARST